MRPADDGDTWDLRQSRRNPLGGMGGGGNVPITLDGTGSGNAWVPPVAPAAPALPIHASLSSAPIGNPVDPMNMGMGMGGWAGGEGMGMAGPITPRMVRPRGDRGW